MKLMREIRFSLRADSSPVRNAWAGWPGAAAVAPFAVLRIQVSGVPDLISGYLCNIQELDHIARDSAIPAMIEICTAQDLLHTERLLEVAWNVIHPRIPADLVLHHLDLHLTPYLSYARHAGDPSVIAVTEAFEFSAAHRLYCPQYSEARNQELFGKCANPNGHGHNYQLEVTVSGELQPEHGTVIPLHEFESIVRRRVIDRFDHKHLNLDCPEFAQRNPSVENIAAVIWELLDGHLPPATLTRVRLWETPKTCAEIER